MYLQQIRRECNRNCVSFSNLLSRFYQMPEFVSQGWNPYLDWHSGI